VTAVLGRTPRSVYRVYTQEEFANAGMVTDWDVSPVRGPARERRFRRLAGMAALAGAVGTVGGAILLASTGSRSAGVPIAAANSPRVGAERSPAPAGQPDPAVRRASAREETGVGRPSSGRPVGRTSHEAAGPGREKPRHRSAPRLKAAVAQGAPASAAQAVPGVRKAASPPVPRQVEFGFER
jgi:hypothetical protein